MSGPNQEGVAAWFDATYREQGFGYLRPFDAYPIFLQLLGAESGESLLDVACGPGLLLRAARERGLDATGIDISHEALGIAGRYAPGARPCHGNAEALPFESGSFRYVTCVGAIERFLDRPRALAEMLRVGAPDARYCFMVRNAATLTWLVWRRWLGRQNRHGHQDADSLESWRELFRRVGFAEEAVYADQWPRQRVRRALRGFRSHDFTRPEPVHHPLLPIRFANEFVFVLRRADPGGGP